MMKLARWWAVFLILTTIETIFLAKLLTNNISVELLVAITLIAIVIFFTLRVEDLNRISIKKDGIEANLLDKVKEDVKKDVKEDVKKDVEKIEGDIQQLLIAVVLDAYDYITLKKINGDEKDDSYNINRPNEEYLLEKLRNRGLIEEKKNSESGFEKIKNRGNSRLTLQLSDYFSITDQGEKYLNVINQYKLEPELKKILYKNGFVA
ncbi:MAG: hypothetical protein F6K54_15295 [Okeania sp. SIO3B5]|uniref:hypothetical protein n=1 Tax=Okeania sp. SIO3B5 TaxID=2607811 RepID=UPI0013FEBEA8|nr:hypothetical protein [Okeania sp. SIO3B5]NEO54328.1 hypothetical protein [Okeania sp. SIO3B5]